MGFYFRTGRRSGVSVPLWTAPFLAVFWLVYASLALPIIAIVWSVQATIYVVRNLPAIIRWAIRTGRRTAFLTGYVVGVVRFKTLPALRRAAHRPRHREVTGSANFRPLADRFTDDSGIEMEDHPRK